MHGADHSTLPTDGGPTVRNLVETIEGRLKKGHTYETLFANRQRTSSRSGILKADAVHRFANALLSAGINQPGDLRDVGEIQLTVSDGGVGFDQQEAMNRQGLGLISTGERLQLVNG